MFCTACAAPNPVTSPCCHQCGHRFDDRVPMTGALRDVLALPANRSAHHLTAGAKHRLGSLAIVLPLLVMVAVVVGFRRADQMQRADWFDRAEGAASAGDYAQAIDAYAAATGFRDADRRRAELVASQVPMLDAYRQGADALGAGRYDEAIAHLAPIVRRYPAFGDAAALLAEARRVRAAALLRRADEAQARRDWLEAERALASLAVADPGDLTVARRLAALRRQHAPLVYARDHALWLVGPDGADEQLLTSAVTVARPIWSPERDRIAFISGNPLDSRAPAALYVIDADGSGLRRLSLAVHPNAVPAWSPDGTRIAYTSVATWNLRREQGLLAIHVVDVDSGIAADVTRQTRRHAMIPSWSPSGDRLAFISRAPPETIAQPATSGPGDVFLLDVASGQVEDLTTGRIPDLVRILWAPRTERILLYARAAGGTSGASAQLITLDASSKELTPLEEGLAPVAVSWSPAWAPDGRRFAYVDGDNTVVIRDDGEEVVRVDTDIQLSGALTWSPDGAALLAVAADPPTPSVVITVEDGTLALTEARIDYDTDWPTGSPQWSPLVSAPELALPTIAGTALDGAGDGPG